jgi:hypothetical protein
MSPLIQVDTDIWIAEGEIVSFYGFPYPTRCVIVRLPDGALWIWSPIKLTEELRNAVSALGTPRHLVSPNKIHHLYLQDWAAEWPDAFLWGPQTTIDKRQDLKFQPALAKGVPEAWQGVIDMVRFTGSFFMDELVFFHRPSRTVILADLSENFGEAFLLRHWKPWQVWIARRWGITTARGYAPLEWRLSFTDRAKARAARDRMIGWSPERVIMAHGEWQKTGGQAYLKRAFGWI